MLKMKYTGPKPEVGVTFSRIIGPSVDIKKYYRIVAWELDPDRRFHYEYILTVEEVEENANF